MKRFLLLLLLITPVWAALPPLSPDTQRARADVIVVGQIEKVETREVDLGEGSQNKVYELDVLVTKTEKGKVTGDHVMATCWTPLKRPTGWVGPQGQNQIPSKGAKVRLYLRDAGEGAYELLEPNGWEPLTP